MTRPSAAFSADIRLSWAEPSDGAVLSASTASAGRQVAEACLSAAQPDATVRLPSHP